MRSGSRIAATMVMAASAALVPLSPASAVGCHDDGCNGLLPEVQGCDNDAKTIASHYDYDGTIGFTLRYSANCGAVWGRLKDDRDANFCGDRRAVRVTNRRWVDSANSFVYASRDAVQTSSTRCFGHTIWTRMVGAIGTSEHLRAGQVLGSTDWYWTSAWQ